MSAVDAINSASLVGRSGEASAVVSNDNTAAAMGSGSVPVFATPALVALMEAAAVAAMKDALDSESTTVGTSISVQHTAASPVGIKVRAVATVTAVEGRKLSFSIEAFDEKESIGKAQHERFIVNHQRFLSKAQSKSK